MPERREHYGHACGEGPSAVKLQPATQQGQEDHAAAPAEKAVDKAGGRAGEHEAELCFFVYFHSFIYPFVFI